MNIVAINENNSITLNLEGWLDTAAAPELGAEIDKIESASAITLDFDKVEYIASSGVRMVVSGYRKAKDLGAEYTVKNVSPEIMNIFKMTQLDKKMNIQAK